MSSDNPTSGDNQQETAKSSQDPQRLYARLVWILN
jgi:hypothetical protein